MKRREAIKKMGLSSAGIATLPYAHALSPIMRTELTRKAFGNSFLWGVATAAYQIEGNVKADGRSPSIWDTFSHKKGKIKTGENGDNACDFYNRYEGDIDLVRQMNFDVFRFSTAWPRIIPEGKGAVNQKGIDFYHRVIDTCLEKGIQPWLTLYHWDLPQVLEDQGGWKNRDIIGWFSDYCDVVTKAYGDKVKNWMILNEPAAFTGVGYLLGMHAPGKLGFGNFLPTAHHACMCQAEGGRIVRSNVPNANVGTTFSCSSTHPFKEHKWSHQRVAEKLDALFNRMHLEPSLGLGYPVEAWNALKPVYKHVKEGDEEKLKFKFDFIGLQNYTRIVARSAFIPWLWGNHVKPEKRGKETTEMGWEIYPEGIYEMLKQFSAYEGVDKIIVTENGAAFPDIVEGSRVHDSKRTKFYKDYLHQVLKAKNEGVNIDGYFCWTLMDNFEWAEGYTPRFGLVHTNYKTQERIIKDTGLWFQQFLKK